MSEKKELNQEQLEKVAGGIDAGYYLPADHGKYIGKYEAEGYIGSEVYIVYDGDREVYYWGTLVKSYEDYSVDVNCGKFQLASLSERMQVIQITGRNNYSLTLPFLVGQTHEFSGDDWTLFLMH